MLTGDNFEGKRYFIENMNGLEFLKFLIINNKFDDRIRMKALTFMYDLVSTDENIFTENP